MATYPKSASDITRNRAQARAREDFERGLPCDASRWGARTGSAWESWYMGAYRALKAKTAINTPPDDGKGD